MLHLCSVLSVLLFFLGYTEGTCLPSIDALLSEGACIDTRIRCIQSGIMRTDISFRSRNIARLHIHGLLRALVIPDRHQPAYHSERRHGFCMSENISGRRIRTASRAPSSGAQVPAPGLDDCPFDEVANATPNSYRS
jgi:hypothetical protein